MDRRLYDKGGHKTERLEDLIGGGRVPLGRDLLRLWATYREGSAEAGCDPDLLDFAQWVGGTGWYAGCEPCEVIW